MVRLKAVRPGGVVPALRFQFHMVRLKAKSVTCAECMVLVSIPYGTIKSGSQSAGANASFVSIPYGTIKSGRVGGEFHATEQFQFHMVRLKAEVSKYGSWMEMFQFHMVRLKVLLLPSSTGPVRFQFHMVRLKDEGKQQVLYVQPVSIPYGTIKRVRR